MPPSSRMDRLYRSGQQGLVRGGLKGLEKESLRLTAGGLIAQTPHPSALGSALTHPWITTDYSEALIELITPPCKKWEEALDFMGEIHTFVHHHLEDELLLATSMPIGLDGDDSIPIARYGHSNIGQMKHIYRRGLAYRYGRTMQSIAGVHFNYSVNENLWPILHELDEHRGELADFIAEAYFGVIRNVHRYGWLLIYLFGNSPAICKSFFRGRESLASRFAELDSDTLYRPNATSLRMSDIGYRNDNQTTLDISVNSLSEYIASLDAATNQPCQAYEAIGIKVDGEYRQLNANILQIENEYYSPIRPKQITHSGEKPTLALKKRGVRYVELRALDLLCTEPGGISMDEMRFLEVFVLFCLMNDSPLLDLEEKSECNRNSLNVACCARGKDFMLFRKGRNITLRQWASEILDQLLPLADILDEEEAGQPYRNSIEKHRQAVADPEQTLSAIILREMRSNRESFTDFALRLSQQHAKVWKHRTMSEQRNRELIRQTDISWQKQAQIEASDKQSLDQYLQQYWAQS